MKLWSHSKVIHFLNEPNLKVHCINIQICMRLESKSGWRQGGRIITCVYALTGLKQTSFCVLISINCIYIKINHFYFQSSCLQFTHFIALSMYIRELHTMGYNSFLPLKSIAFFGDCNASISLSVHLCDWDVMNTIFFN